MEGIFHDAHEVYTVTADGVRTWVGTFATKAIATDFAESDPIPGAFSLEVTPV